VLNSVAILSVNLSGVIVDAANKLISQDVLILQSDLNRLRRYLSGPLLATHSLEE
jgi:hypothetical protein